MKSIRYFQLDSMQATPFCNGVREFEKFAREYLIEHGIVSTNNPAKADFFVKREFPGLRISSKLRIRYGNKPILVWTHEPRMSTYQEPRMKRFGLPDVYIVNNYTGNLRLSNLSIEAPLYGPMGDEEVKAATKLTGKKTAYIASYVSDLGKWDLYIKEVPRRLMWNCHKPDVTLTVPQ